MRFDASSPFVWREINQNIKQLLGCQSNVAIYRGLPQALFETCLGLNLRFGHKRKIVVQVGLGDHLSRVEVEMARLGVRFKDKLDADIKKEEKEVLTYIHDLDDALTGELYDHIDTLKMIAPTKLYRIHVAHHLFHIKKAFINKLGDYDIIITSLSPDYCLVFTGEKVSLPVLTVGQLNWNLQQDFKAIEKMLSSDQKLFQKEITAFEGSLPDGVEPWFKNPESKRIFDRAVVVVKDHDSSALQDLILETMAIEKSAPGYDIAVESASLCRWQNQAWFERAEKFDRSRDDMRGLLAIDGSCIDEKFVDIFLESLQRLKSLSI